MKILSSEEFISESISVANNVGDIRFCKLTEMKFCSLELLFRDYFKRLANIDDKLLNDWNSVMFENYYNDKVGDWKSLPEVCGCSYEFVSTDKGDKYVFTYDTGKEIWVYPVVEANGKPKDYIEVNPSFPYLMFAVKTGSNVARLHRLGKMFDLNDYNYGRATSRPPLLKPSELFAMLDEHTANWGVEGRLRGTVAECRKIVSDYWTDTTKSEYIHRQRHFTKTIRYYHNSELALEVESEAYGTLYNISRYASRLGDNTEIYRKLFAFAMKYDIEDALAADIHPSTVGMVNKKNIRVNNTRYIARNLPKDDYELIDTYRNKHGEVCEHCGKEHIVNIMVIENPQGEVFHVGNECVWRLVNIPEEEFDEWNQPFTDAYNAINLYNKNEKNGIHQYWFIYGDNAYFVYCDRPFDQYDFLNTDKAYDHERKEPVKTKFKCKEYTGVHNITGGESINYTGVEFLKRMLPVYYKQAVVIDHNIMDIVDTVTKSKTENWKYITYDGFKYDIGIFDRLEIVPDKYEFGKEYTYNEGDLKVEVRTISENWEEYPYWKATLGNCKVEVSYTCDELEGTPNPYLK